MIYYIWVWYMGYTCGCGLWYMNHMVVWIWNSQMVCYVCITYGCVIWIYHMGVIFGIVMRVLNM